MARRIELVSGLAAGGLGVLLALVAALAAETMPGGLASRTVVFLGLFALWASGVAAGAIWHVRSGARSGLALLWVGAALMLLFTIAAAFSIGGLLAPATLLAVVATVAGASSQATLALARRDGRPAARDLGGRP